MAPLAVFLFLASTPPSSLDCIGAHARRNEAAVQLRVFFNREVEHGYLNRAEIGAVRSLTKQRARLLACASETDL